MTDKSIYLLEIQQYTLTQCGLTPIECTVSSQLRARVSSHITRVTYQETLFFYN